MYDIIIIVIIVVIIFINIYRLLFNKNRLIKVKKDNYVINGGSPDLKEVVETSLLLYIKSNKENSIGEQVLQILLTSPENKINDQVMKIIKSLKVVYKYSQDQVY